MRTWFFGGKPRVMPIPYPADMNISVRAALALAGLLLSPGLAQTTPSALTATASAPRTATATQGVEVRITLRNGSGNPQTIQFGHNSAQECALAPHVRVLRVGTREVVYPAANAEPRFCTQELRGETVPANGETALSRTLRLPAGEFMVEVWAKGFLNDEQVFVPAQPVRVTVQ